MTWSRITAGGSATTWTGNVDAATALWTPYGERADLSGGADFIPKASTMAAGRASDDRPIATWSLSVITASGYTAERLP